MARGVDPAVRSPTTCRVPAGGGWHGEGDGFVAYPQLASLAGLAGANGAAAPEARAIAELAMPRTRGGPWRRRCRRAAAVRSSSRRADQRRARRRCAALRDHGERGLDGLPVFRRPPARVAAACAGDLAYVAALEAQDSRSAMDARQFSRCARRRLRDARRRARRPHRCIRRADAGAGRSADSECLRRPGNAPPGPRPRARRQFIADARRADAEQMLPGGAGIEQRRDRALRERRLHSHRAAHRLLPTDGARRGARGRTGHAPCAVAVMARSPV